MPLTAGTERSDSDDVLTFGFHDRPTDHWDGKYRGFVFGYQNLHNPLGDKTTRPSGFSKSTFADLADKFGDYYGDYNTEHGSSSDSKMQARASYDWYVYRVEFKEEFFIDKVTLHLKDQTKRVIELADPYSAISGGKIVDELTVEKIQVETKIQASSGLGSNKGAYALIEVTQAEGDLDGFLTSGGEFDDSLEDRPGVPFDSGGTSQRMKLKLNEIEPSGAGGKYRFNSLPVGVSLYEQPQGGSSIDLSAAIDAGRDHTFYAEYDTGIHRGSAEISIAWWKEGDDPDSVPATLATADSVVILPVDMDFLHPATGEMSEERERGKGGLIALSEDGNEIVTELKLRQLNNASSVNFKLVFDSSKVKVWMDRQRTQLFQSDETALKANQDTTLYLEGLKKSNSARDVSIDLRLQIGEKDYPATEAKATVVQAEFKTTIQAFIPYLWVDVPFGWLLAPFDGGRVALGDNRGFDSTLERTFRTRHTLVITPFPDLSTSIIKSSFADGSSSTHYRTTTSVPEADRSTLHGYTFTDDPEITEGPSPGIVTGPFDKSVKQSDTKVWFNTYLWSYEGVLGYMSVPIRWNMSFTFDLTNPAKPKVSLEGERGGFPAHEVYVEDSNDENVPIYRWMPGEERGALDLLLLENIVVPEPTEIP